MSLTIQTSVINIPVNEHEKLYKQSLAIFCTLPLVYLVNKLHVWDIFGSVFVVCMCSSAWFKMPHYVDQHAPLWGKLNHFQWPTLMSTCAKDIYPKNPKHRVIDDTHIELTVIKYRLNLALFLMEKWRKNWKLVHSAPLSTTLRERWINRWGYWYID